MTAAEIVPIRQADSHSATKWARSIPVGFLMNGRGVDTSARHVLLVLAMHADNATGLAWPSKSTIAEYTGLSEKTVARCLARLEQSGLITHVGMRGAKQWLLRFDACTAAPDVRAQQRDRKRQGTAERMRRLRARRSPEDHVTRHLSVTCDAPSVRHDAHVTQQTSPCDALDVPRTTKELPKNFELPKDAASDDAAGVLFDTPEPPPKSETAGQLANRLTRIYTDKVKLTAYLAVQGVVKLAIKSGEYSNRQIATGMAQLAEERRVVTANTLRIAIEGSPQGRNQLPERMTVPKPNAAVWQDKSALEF
jgi:DNA-binding Lrp family transcriptional regulator